MIVITLADVCQAAVVERLDQSGILAKLSFLGVSARDDVLERRNSAALREL
jgi:hypothetical protein